MKKIHWSVKLVFFFVCVAILIFGMTDLLRALGW